MVPSMFMNNYSLCCLQDTAAAVDVLLNVEETFLWKRAGENGEMSQLVMTNMCGVRLV